MDFFSNFLDRNKKNWVEKIDWDVIFINFRGEKYVFEAAKNFAWDNFIEYLRKLDSISKINKKDLMYHRACMVCSDPDISHATTNEETHKKVKTVQGYGHGFYDKKIIRAGDFAIYELAKYHWKRLHKEL